MFGGDGGVDFLDMTEEVDEVGGAQETALAFDTPAEEGRAGTFLIHPNAVQQVGAHREFQVRLSWARAIKDFQRWLASVEQHFGVGVAEVEADDQIAVGKGRNLLRVIAQAGKDTLEDIVKLLFRCEYGHSRQPFRINCSKSLAGETRVCGHYTRWERAAQAAVAGGILHNHCAVG
jgi:hypothetical protein